jgi:hypothetical protein
MQRANHQGDFQMSKTATLRAVEKQEEPADGGEPDYTNNRPAEWLPGDEPGAAAAALASDDFNDDITAGLEAAVDEGVAESSQGTEFPIAVQLEQPKGIERATVPEAQSYMTNALNGLMERKAACERRMHMHAEARAERDRRSKEEYEASMEIEHAELARITVLKEGVDLFLGRLNKGA